MGLEDKKIAAFGDELYEAWRNARQIAPLTDRESSITIEDAYRVQMHTIERRIGDGEWQLEEGLVPDHQAKLRYHSKNGDQELGTAWSYGLKLSTWSAQGWSDTHIFTNQLWTTNTKT